MKFTVNCDCTPEEARAFFGLPDFAPMQKAMMADMQEKMQQNMATGGMQAFSDLQKAIWDQMMVGMGEPTSKKRKA